MSKAKEAKPSEEEAPEGGEGAGEGVDLPQKKISGKKLVLIIVAVVVLLLGGGGAGLYFSGVLSPKPVEGEEHAAAAEGEHGAEKASTAPIYLELPPILVNLTSTSRRPVYAKVRVSLVLDKEEDKTKVTEAQPRIIDSFQTYLRELTVEELQGSAGLLRLREELLVRVNAAIAPVAVKDILFQEILPQ